MEKYGPPKPDGDYVIDHINGDGTDNRIDNLRWLRRCDNVKRNLKDGEAWLVKRLLKKSNLTHRAIGAMFKQHRNMIGQINIGRVYRNV